MKKRIVKGDKILDSEEKKVVELNDRYDDLIKHYSEMAVLAQKSRKKKEEKEYLEKVEKYKQRKAREKAIKDIK